MQNLFKKLDYLFLFESTKIESATFPYKTALSEANAKKNGESKILFSLRTSYKELIWCSNHPNAYINTFRKR